MHHDVVYHPNLEEIELGSGHDEPPPPYRHRENSHAHPRALPSCIQCSSKLGRRCTPTGWYTYALIVSIPSRCHTLSCYISD
ncbi:hypothetical protein BDV11DRAFT_148128 [Aspergillus similis]